MAANDSQTVGKINNCLSSSFPRTVCRRRRRCCSSVFFRFPSRPRGRNVSVLLRRRRVRCFLSLVFFRPRTDFPPETVVPIGTTTTELLSKCRMFYSVPTSTRSFSFLFFFSFDYAISVFCCFRLFVYCNLHRSYSCVTVS